MLKLISGAWTHGSNRFKSLHTPHKLSPRPSHPIANEDHTFITQQTGNFVVVGICSVKCWTSLYRASWLVRWCNSNGDIWGWLPCKHSVEFDILVRHKGLWVSNMMKLCFLVCVTWQTEHMKVHTCEQQHETRLTDTFLLCECVCCAWCDSYQVNARNWQAQKIKARPMLFHLREE